MKTTRPGMFVAALLATAVALSGAQALAAENPKSEAELIEALRTAAPAEKALACKHLATLGSKAAVPELAKLLVDGQLASWARIALESILDPAADEALRSAAGKLEGKLLVGAINSIGVRRDAAAVELLSGRLKDQDADVASAAAVALGLIGNDTAIKTLRQSLAAAPAPVADAVAEGCILGAERLMHDGRLSEAVAVYDDVRRAKVSKPRKLDATRGAILARESAGVPLLLEQLRSPDRAYYQIGLSTARELGGSEVASALAAELGNTSPDRAVKLLYVLAERREISALPAIMNAAQSGDKHLRVVALVVVGLLGDAASLAPLLQAAVDADADVAAAAKSAIAALGDKQVDAEIKERLATADGAMLIALIDLVGQRRISATELLTKQLESSDQVVRETALAALGNTVGPTELGVLIAPALQVKQSADEAVALRALRAASLRMPDRDACAGQLASAMPKASATTQAVVLEILGAMGGTKALETIDAAMKTGDSQLQDVGSRVLGEWLSIDAAPVLLDLSKRATDDKYRVRALRGYIRLARQYDMPVEQRAAMCQTAIAAANRLEEQKLALTVLERFPSPHTLKVAAQTIQRPEARDDARRVAIAIAEKLGEAGAKAREVLAESSLEAVQLEIVKAVYGAEGKQKDVTELLQKCVDGLPLVLLPSPSFNESFGGDPAPDVAKTLVVEYRMNGRAGEATFAEDALIALPMPK
ncbi:MAG: DUF3395 domain-containing protein [Pirellulales bacterium]|nr:DUF3395 domain-containing protein [Pirellulales bacterium]